MQTYESPYEWPRFEDGELVRVGDEIEHEGAVRTVGEVAANKFGWVLLLEPQGIVFGGEDLRRPFRDTQEKIDADAEKTPCKYFGRKAMDCEGCRGQEGETRCDVAKVMELLRRQRELDAREAAKGGER